MRRQPCSTIGWSSMIKTLAIGGRSAFWLARQRDADPHPGAAARRGFERAFAAQRPHALLHAAQAEARGRVWVDPAAVVLDRELDPRRGAVARRRLIEGDADVVRL